MLAISSGVPVANSYAVGLRGSKRPISDPLFIRRDVSGYLSYRQSDRVCRLFFFCCALSGGVRYAGVGQANVSSNSFHVVARGFQGVCIDLIVVLKRTSSSRLFREQSVRLARWKPSSASSSQLWR